MKLASLLEYDNICIQCHDNPDADAIASAFGLYLYFKEHKKNVYITYGGNKQITKPNLLLIIKELNIPISFFPQSFSITDGLLITVDCQPGESNVSPIECDHVACIDHHHCRTDLEMSDIRSYLGSCSTLVWKLLSEEKFNFDLYPNLGTALYYGLMTDTTNFIESLHPLDRDMKDSLAYDNSLIVKCTNSNISIKELEIAGIALIRHIYNDDHRFAVVHAEACDPNILGLISDLVLQVDKIDTCVVYNHLEGGFKISVRSCIKEVRANELAEFLTYRIGSGGGHVDKAGGFIFENMYESFYPTINTETYFGLRMTEYFDSIKIVYAKERIHNVSDMELYEKIPNIVGCVDLADFMPIGSNIIIRTLENDIETKVTGNYYVILGVNGDVYTIKKELFAPLYNIIDDPYVYDGNYIPTVRTNLDDTSYRLSDYAKSCVPRKGIFIYAKELDYTIKVFPLWDENKYLLGKPGDYLVCRKDNLFDLYVVGRKTFELSYRKL